MEIDGGGGNNPYDGYWGDNAILPLSQQHYNPIANTGLTNRQLNQSSESSCPRISTVVGLASAMLGVGSGIYYLTHLNDEKVYLSSDALVSPSFFLNMALVSFGVTALVVAVRCCKNKAAASGDSANGSNGVNRAGVDQASVQSPSAQHAYVQHQDSSV